MPALWRPGRRTRRVVTSLFALALLMQLAPGGRTLRRELDEESPSVARRFQLIRGVCAGMAALHSHGVLHLDIKPTNVLIGGDGAPLLADFGLSIQLSTTLSSVAASTPAGGGRGPLVGSRQGRRALGRSDPRCAAG